VIGWQLSVVGNPTKCILVQLDVVVTEKRCTMSVVLLHTGWHLEGSFDVSDIFKTNNVIIHGGGLGDVAHNSVFDALANSLGRCSKVNISSYSMFAWVALYTDLLWESTSLRGS
jgi:hypothetical protein